MVAVLEAVVDRLGDDFGLVAVEAARGPCRPSASITVGSRATVTGRGDPDVATEARGGRAGNPFVLRRNRDRPGAPLPSVVRGATDGEHPVARLRSSSACARY